MWLFLCFLFLFIRCNVMETLNNFFESFASIAWGQPTQLLLLGAGLFFALSSKFRPYQYITYAFDILRGKHPSTGEGS